MMNWRLVVFYVIGVFCKIWSKRFGNFIKISDFKIILEIVVGNVPEGRRNWTKTNGLKGLNCSSFGKV